MRLPSCGCQAGEAGAIPRECGYQAGEAGAIPRECGYQAGEAGANAAAKLVELARTFGS